MNQSRTIIEFGTSKLICLAGTSLERAIEVEGVCCLDYAGIKNDNWVDAASVADMLEKAVASVERDCRRSARDVTFGVPACYTDVITVKNTVNVTGRIVTDDDIVALETRCALEPPRNWMIIDTRPAYFTDSAENVYITPPVGISSAELSACYVHTLAFEPFISDVDAMLADMKIRIEGMESETLATALYLIPQQARDSAALLVDIGMNDTSVSAVFGDCVLKTEVAHMGGAHLAEAIARELHIDKTLAENIKRAYVYGMDCAPDMRVYAKDKDKKMRSFSQSVIRDIIEPKTLELISEIAACIKSMNEFLQRSTPVYLTGGGLLLQNGSVPLIEKSLKRKTVAASVKNVKLQSPVYYTALALLDNAEYSVYHLEGEEPKQSVLTKLMGTFFTKKK